MDKDYLQLNMEKADAIRDMLKTPGWKILEDWINTTIQGMKDKLLMCPLKEVEPLRSKIITLTTLKSLIPEILERAEESRQTLLQNRYGENG